VSAETGGPAFPVPIAPYGRDLRATDEPGMTLRDYFAAKAMPFVAGRAELDHTSPSEWAAACYEVADALLVERERPIAERDNDRLAAEAQHARAHRFSVVLNALVDAVNAVDQLPAHIGTPLQEAVALLEDDSIPF